jgi:hypothetical protein
MTRILRERTVMRPIFCFLGIRRVAWNFSFEGLVQITEDSPILGITRMSKPTSAKMLRMAEAYRGGMSLEHFDGAKVQAPMICQSREEKLRYEWGLYLQWDDIERQVKTREGLRI